VIDLCVGQHQSKTKLSHSGRCSIDTGIVSAYGCGSMKMMGGIVNRTVMGRVAAMLSLWLAFAWSVGARAQHAGAVGIFEGHGDVGTVGAEYKGSVEYDAARQSYLMAGSGENMWGAADAFQFAWVKMSGDVEVSAEISFLGKGKNPHRKAVVMVRQSLDADSAYADVALHGVGLTSLQFREQRGATTREVQASISAPKQIRLVKRGGYYTMWVAGEDGKFVLAGASPPIGIKEPFYVGIGVCSHEKDVVEKAMFSKVVLRQAM
jgi:TolB protein